MLCSAKTTEYLTNGDPGIIAIGIELFRSDFYQSHDLIWDLYYDLIDNKALYPSQFPYTYSIKPEKFIVSLLVQQLCEEVIPNMKNNTQTYNQKQVDDAFDEAQRKCC